MDRGLLGPLEDSHQLEQNRELGGKHDGAIEDLENVGELKDVSRQVQRDAMQVLGPRQPVGLL